jgi:alanyl-tRNA synthetase
LLFLSFDATVKAHGAFGGKASVVLDATAFYPEAGGQLADHGTLSDAAVIDVQVDDAGVVHHLIGAEVLPAIGSVVRGAIERQRRRQFMAQHTGQHMLSRALLDEAQAETVSSRLGETVSTIDLGVEVLSEAALARAEALVNAAIDDDLPVHALFPTAAELERLPLRRKPKVTDNIRVLVVGDVDKPFDVSPCGGTHVVRTAQIGAVRVTGMERYKGMTRVSFQAGARGRAEVYARAKMLEELAKSMSASPGDVPLFVDKLRAELKAERSSRTALQAQLATLLGEALSRTIPSEAPALVPVAYDAPSGVDREMLRPLASAFLALRPTLALALCCPDGDGLAVLVSRGAASTVDCGAALKAIAQKLGGKGGGKPEQATGKVPATTAAAWTSAVASA